MADQKEAARQSRKMQELSDLTVYRETSVGWDENTPPNEAVDGSGKIVSGERSFAVADPNAPQRRSPDDSEVLRLRDKLREHNGIHGLEICTPDEVERAARVFHRDGFVVVRDLLEADQLSSFREGSARVLKQILEVPGIGDRKYMTESFRLPHRYSYGTSSASRQLLHDPVWASMVDLPTTTPILAEIFGTADYFVSGAGGDLCLPGAIEYQHLHGDVREYHEMTPERVQQAIGLGVKIDPGSDPMNLDLATQRKVVDITPAAVTINFVMSDLTWENGPIRHIPGTHIAHRGPPSQEDEPEWMRMSTLVGAPAGAGVFRDGRAWHGATPNLSREIRALPNVEYLAPWLGMTIDKKTMPHEIWETLTLHGQKICGLVKAEPGVWPAGAGVMHPLAEGRKQAFESMKADTPKHEADTNSLRPNRYPGA